MEKDTIIIGNWKMYKTNKEVKEYLHSFTKNLSDTNVQVGFAVPFTAISLSAKELQDQGIWIGAQNMNSADEGAFTGEIAGKMLKDAGADFVILGHSERRTLFHETNEMIASKVKKALEEELKVVLCIGESLEQRENGYEEHLEEQISSALKDVDKSKTKNIIVAYEPIWAIGTGKSAGPKDVEKTHLFIKKILQKIFGKTVKIPIIYGGSVKKENIVSYMEKKSISGALVGGASLKAKDFSEIVQLSES